LDVHAQYVPMDGVVSGVEYDRTGRFSIAYTVDKSIHNEKMITTISTSRGTIKVYQIAGMVTRHIVSYLSSAERVRRGEKLGMICLGSRVDLELPYGVLIRVKAGDVIRGGRDVIASWSV